MAQMPGTPPMANEEIVTFKFWVNTLKVWHKMAQKPLPAYNLRKFKMKQTPSRCDNDFGIKSKYYHFLLVLVLLT